MLFLNSQPSAVRKKYFSFLKSISAFSRLFSDSETPYLHYRIHENLFCRAFDAKNHSRADLSADAVKDEYGIGLKTFLENNSRSFQKIAEFNADRLQYAGKSAEEAVRIIANLRNERIAFTKRAYSLQRLIYHCVTRKKGQILVYEIELSPIDVEHIRLTSRKNAGFQFHDGAGEYNFNLSKSTLLKRFSTPSSAEVLDVHILDDPFTFLNIEEETEAVPELFTPARDERSFALLPMYSPGKKEVPIKSGLNQWNAGGRGRHPSEVYLPIPRWVHSHLPGFFPSRDQHFSLKLPGGRTLSAKICQDNDKALMSDPNKELGEWLLRTVLKLNEGELATYDHLRKVGADSVILFKNGPHDFEIDFRPLGSYEDFELQHKA